MINLFQMTELEDIKGQDLDKLRSYALNKSKKPLLIYGPSGTGKTSSIHLLAKEMDYEIIEINASDCRNKEAIESIVGNASKQASLTKKGKILLVDEIDGISGNSDRGGMNALIELAEESRFPIIATMTDLEKLEDIKKNFVLLEYKKLSDRQIYDILERHCIKNNLIYNADELNIISSMANGDARNAAISLGIAVANNEVDKKSVDMLFSMTRESVDESLVKMFKSRNLDVVLKSISELENDLVDMTKVGIRPVLFDNEGCLIYFVEENLPYEYNDRDLMNGFELLSKADIFHRRITRWQYYRYLVYIQALLAAVCLAKENKNAEGFICRKTSRSPKNNKKLWWMVSKKKSDISEKIAIHASMSSKKVMKDFGYYKIILRKDPIKDLNEEEINYLNS